MASHPTVREGRAKPGGPYEGVPGHLGPPLSHWLREELKGSGSYAYPREDLMYRVAAAARLTLPGGFDLKVQFQWMLDRWQEDPEGFLDLLHVALQVAAKRTYRVDTLDNMLELGGSVWRATDRGLERRIDASAQTTFEEAASPADTASAELSEAWAKAYGRDPNPSDAWDHAIKAVEAILIPVVVPKQDKPQFGHVVGTLDRQGEQWKLLLPGPDEAYSVAPLAAMLRLIWPNPDRHGSPQHNRPPTLQEARAVVHLAVTIVQWSRDNLILRK